MNLVFESQLKQEPRTELSEQKLPKTMVDVLYDFWWLIFIILGMIFLTLKKMYWGN